MAKDRRELQRLIVVDGDVLVRHVLSDYLRTCGYTVIEAATTDEAMSVLSDATVGVRAMLCDADAPGQRTAFELRTWTRKERPEIEVVLAGNVSSAANKAAELCDEGPQLKRPYDPQSISDYIKRIMGSQDRKAG
jgi:DNA-binding NtrC family response regulator